MEDTKNNEQGIHIPVMVGNCAPFRLVLRENDTWSPTLEQINSKDYDYVKLCRLSCYIDIGIAPYSLGICFDGSLVLPATTEFSSRESALRKFNEVLGIVFLGGVYSEAIHPTDISHGALFVDGYLKQMNGASGYESAFHISVKNKIPGALDVIRLLDPWRLSVSDFTNAYVKGMEIYTKLEGVSVGLLLNGTSNYVKHQWAEALIFLWTSIEQVINIIWLKEIVLDVSHPGEAINGRSKFLKDFRTWTTATKIEVLYQVKIITSSQYAMLSEARKARNDFVHNGKPLDKEDVKSALEVLFQIISLKVSSYRTSSLLDSALADVYRHERDDLILRSWKRSLEGVTHWIPAPKLPGDKGWGDRPYEIIEELVLRRVK